MSKVNAIINLIFCLLVAIGVSGNIVAAIMHGNIEVFKFVASCVVFVLCVAWVVKTIVAFKQGSFAPVVRPESPGKMVIYDLGNLFLIISGIVAAYTVGLMIYLFIKNTTGVPVGMGFGIVIILYVIGQSLKGMAQETHNKSLKSGTPQSGAP